MKSPIQVKIEEMEEERLKGNSNMYFYKADELRKMIRRYCKDHGIEEVSNNKNNKGGIN